MANIIGTEGVDILQGTDDNPRFISSDLTNDTISGLGGDDRIIGSTGNDIIDGGEGNDVLDYGSFAAGNLSLRLDELNRNLEILKTNANDFKGIDKINNIETIIGNSNAPSIEFLRTPSDVSFDIDLAANRLSYTSSQTGVTKTLTVKNFKSIVGGNSGKDRLAGDDSDNNIFSFQRGDTIVGSKGNDKLVRGSNFDYSKLGTDIKIAAEWSIVPAIRTLPASIAAKATANKGEFGTDKIDGIFGAARIIGAADRENTLDASSDGNIAKLNVNLANNSLQLNFDNSTLSDNYQLVNFKNFIGGKSNDTIVGGNNGGKLTGGGGSDTITGGSGKDVICGASASSRGVGEVDILTGGGGKDKFVLGDNNGAYYVSNGANDYALINDFNIFQDSISIGNLKDYSLGFSNNTIDLYSGKDINTRDLIAKIQIAGGSLSSKTSMASNGMMPNSVMSVDPLASQLNIVSDSNVVA
jgi:Ca2+-binding RTX toxin-like protein